MTVHQNGHVEAATPLGLGDGGSTPPSLKVFCVETCRKYPCDETDYDRVKATSMDLRRAGRCTKYVPGRGSKR